MILLLAAAAQAMSGPSLDDVVGRWQAQSDNGVIEITRCGASICGNLITSDRLRADPGQVDGRNRNASLRTRRLAGLSILSGFRRTSNSWTGGTIYDGQDGGTYSATITLADANHLRLRGCIIWLLCKTETWTRIE